MDTVIIANSAAQIAATAAQMDPQPVNLTVLGIEPEDIPEWENHPKYTFVSGRRIK